MAVVKWMLMGLLAVAGTGFFGMALTEGGIARPLRALAAVELSLRAFPSLPSSAASTPAAAPAPAAKPAPPEPSAIAAPVKPAPEPAPAAEPSQPKSPPPPAPAPAPKTPPAPPPAATTPPAPTTPPKPAPAEPAAPAARPPEAAVPIPSKPPPSAPAEGLLNLRASDTADVYLDGKKLGGSPLLGIKARVGSHKVRFDCYDSAGNSVPGPPQNVTVKTEGEVDLEYTCPTE